MDRHIIRVRGEECQRWGARGYLISKINIHFDAWMMGRGRSLKTLGKKAPGGVCGKRAGTEAGMNLEASEVGKGGSGRDAAKRPRGPPLPVLVLAPGLRGYSISRASPRLPPGVQGPRTRSRPGTHEGPGSSLVPQSPLGQTGTNPHKHPAQRPPWFYRAPCPSPPVVPPGRGGPQSLC